MDAKADLIRCIRFVNFRTTWLPRGTDDELRAATAAQHQPAKRFSRAEGLTYFHQLCGELRQTAPARCRPAPRRAARPSVRGELSWAGGLPWSPTWAPAQLVTQGWVSGRVPVGDGSLRARALALCAVCWPLADTDFLLLPPFAPLKNKYPAVL